MFVTVTFNDFERRTYTYEYHGAEDLSPGDYVVVETRDGNKPVEVVDVDVPAPPFRCKEIAAVLSQVWP